MRHFREMLACCTAAYGDYNFQMWVVGFQLPTSCYASFGAVNVNLHVGPLVAEADIAFGVDLGEGVKDVGYRGDGEGRGGLLTVDSPVGVVYAIDQGDLVSAGVMLQDFLLRWAFEPRGFLKA